MRPVEIGTRRYREKVRDVALARDGRRCQICGDWSSPLHVDHIRPRILGGTNELANLRTLCYRCNLTKGGSAMSDADVLAVRQATGPGPARRRPFGPPPASIFSRRPRPY